MAFLKQEVLLFIGFFISCFSVVLAARHHRDSTPYTPPNLKRLTDLFPRQTYNQRFYDYFGGSNIKVKENGSLVDLNLNKYTGSGFYSQNRYHYGFFSASMKLPSGSYTAGIVVAFYLSNADVYPKNHDEIDFELLGHANRKPWTLQTNVYGNGSVKYTGREEKIRLWFDPTKEFHAYTIIWNAYHIVFLVDNVPIRQVIHGKSMSPAYPLKPMSLYATLWDGSDWATDGGKYKVDYKLAPFTSSFGKLQIEGCILNKNQTSAPSPSPSPTPALSPAPSPTPRQSPAPTMPLSPSPLSPTASRAPSPLPPSTPTFSCTKSINTNGASSADPVDGEDVIKFSSEQKKAMEDVRKKFLIYSYCNDIKRYKVLPAECNNE